MGVLWIPGSSPSDLEQEMTETRHIQRFKEVIADLDMDMRLSSSDYITHLEDMKAIIQEAEDAFICDHPELEHLIRRF